MPLFLFHITLYIVPIDTFTAVDTVDVYNDIASVAYFTAVTAAADVSAVIDVSDVSSYTAIDNADILSSDVNFASFTDVSKFTTVADFLLWLLLLLLYNIDFLLLDCLSLIFSFYFFCD